MRATFVIAEHTTAPDVASGNRLTVYANGLAERCQPGIKALHWLLEEADWVSPIHRELGRVHSAWEAADAMGDLLGSVLCGSRDGSDLVAAARGAGPEQVCIEIASEDQDVISLPWELARISWPDDRTPSRLCELGSLIRVPPGRLDVVLRPMELPLRVLSIVPRPFGFQDVGVSGTQGPLVAAAAAWPDLITLKQVRPSTWQALLAEVERCQEYDVLHFDGHGVQGADGQVCLAFENSEGPKGIAINASKMVGVARIIDPKVIILAACRSAARAQNAASFSAELARALPRTQVVGMSHSVSTDTVQVLLSTFIPRLLDSGSAISATGAAQRELYRLWRQGEEAGRPDYVIPTVFGSPQNSTTLRHVGVLPALDRQSITICLLSREHELLSFDQAVHAAGNSIELVGEIQSGKSTFLTAYRRYLQATGSPRLQQSHGQLDIEIVESSDMTLAQQSGRFYLQIPPPRIGAAWMRELTDRGLLPPEPPLLGSLGWELIFLLGAHFGSMSLFETLAAHLGPRAAVEEIRWGVGIDVPSTEIDAVRNRLSGLDAKTLADAALLGTFDQTVTPALLSVVSDAFLKDGSYESVFGRRTPAERWVAVLDELSRHGLCSPASTESGRVHIYVIPIIVSYVLREMLSEAVGPLNLARLQQDAGQAVHAMIVVGRPSSVEDDNTPYGHEMWLRDSSAFLESNVDRSLGYYLRTGEDLTAASLAMAWLSGKRAGTGAFEQAIGVLRHRVDYDRSTADQAPAVTAIVEDALSAEAVVKERWQSGLLHVNRSLELQAAIDNSPLNAVVQYIRQARCLWRTGRTKEARDALSTAAGLAQDDEWELRAVAVATDDMRLYLGVQESGSSGDLSEPETSMVLRSRRLEEIGDLEGALQLWIKEHRESGLRMDSSAMALSLLEVGRIRTLIGDRTGLADLMRSLEIRYRTGMAVERNLYLLGMALEAAGELERADEALDAAWRASEAGGGEGNRADIAYERGLVSVARAQQADDSAQVDAFLNLAFDYLAESRAAYRALSRAKDEADALMTMAQVRFYLRDPAAARDLRDEAISVGGEEFTRVRSQVIADVERMFEDQ